MNNVALSDLLLRMADDELIIAHRHSEWTGLGPLLEEDIAFSSIAQDKLGHAQALYQINCDLCGGDVPDVIAFQRAPEQFRCSQFVELPNDEYDASLVRHFLFDVAEYLRYGMLASSSLEPLAKLSRKIHGELRYHLYHAKTWVEQLSGKGTEVSKARMQQALNHMWPYALGMFEPGVDEEALKHEGVFNGEADLQTAWLQFVMEALPPAVLTVPHDAEPVFGGRKGYHTEHLAPLLVEMTEVVRIDPQAEW
jgi:ring-1,2-phenylacetyl-CoA epoxidase subunit PaaC